MDRFSLIYPPSPCNPGPSALAAMARAETSSTFQEPAQLRADEGQFSLFKNKARSVTTDLWRELSRQSLSGREWKGGRGDQLVINIYMVSYCKEKLQFVSHSPIQVVAAKHRSTEAKLFKPECQNKAIWGFGKDTLIWDLNEIFRTLLSSFSLNVFDIQILHISPKGCRQS